MVFKIILIAIPTIIALCLIWYTTDYCFYIINPQDKARRVTLTYKQFKQLFLLNPNDYKIIHGIYNFYFCYESDDLDIIPISFNFIDFFFAQRLYNSYKRISHKEYKKQKQTDNFNNLIKHIWKDTKIYHSESQEYCDKVKSILEGVRR